MTDVRIEYTLALYYMYLVQFINILVTLNCSY
jgi:hypothetical protein